MNKTTLSFLAAAAAMACLAVLAVFSLLSGEKAVFSFSSQSALWLTAWGLLCLLGITVWVLLSRLWAVREQGDRYKEMVQEVNAFITRISEDGTILFMNRYALEFFGWEEGEIVGRNIYGTLIPERDSMGRDLSGLWKQINARDAELHLNENENQRKDGSRVLISWTNRWVEGERHGRRTEERVVLSVGNDCTALHGSRNMLLYLNQAMEHALEGVVVTDLEGVVRFCNPAWARLRGCADPGKLYGSKIDLFRCQGEGGAGGADELNAALQREGRAMGEVSCGGVACFLSAARVHDTAGDPTGYVCVARDVSQSKLQAEELRRAKERAEAADRTKSLILSNVTHEIRTPLNGVLGMLQILLMTDLDERQVEHVNTAMESASDLGGIIDTILKFSEVDSSADQVLVQPFSLLNTVVGVMQAHRRTAAEKGLGLEFKAEPGTVEALEGDGGRVRRIAEIIVGNAIKFTQEGSVTLSVGTQQADPPDELELRLQVSDTGVGIASDRLPLILSGFEQGDQTYSRRFGGLGLGLCMARRLAESMGGEVSIESQEGKGTVASLRLRMNALSESMGGGVPPQAPRTAAGRLPRVLLALCNDLDCVALKFYLESRAVDVELSASPVQGLDMLTNAGQEAVFDMAVFNVNGLEGQEMLDALRKTEASFTVPLVLLGGKPEEVCDMAFVIRCAAYPVVPAELWDLLLTTLS